MSSTDERHSLGVSRVRRQERPVLKDGSPEQDQRPKQEGHGDQEDQNVFARAFKLLGPGLITGASDDDPAGIVTYAMAGATLGFSILWTALITIPLMMGIQLISARIGLVRGSGIAGVIKNAYGRRWLLYPATGLVLIANVINIGADIGAIAQAIQLETGIPSVWLVVPITIAIVATLTFAGYKFISTIFKWLTLPLLAYILAAFLARPSLSALAKGTFIPHFSFNQQFIAIFVAIMGTTITPYLWFWQASQEVEEQKEMQHGERPTRREKQTQLKRTVWDIASGMVLSNVVMYSVIVATAATLHQNGTHDITTSAQVATALQPAAGSLATLLFAIGIIGAGTLAVPILAGSASYAVGESFGWKVGIDRPWYRAKAFYGVIVVACLIGMVVNFVGISAVSLLFWSAIINGMIAPPLMVVIMLVSGDDALMQGKGNNAIEKILGWTATAVMSAAAIAMLWTL